MIGVLDSEELTIDEVGSGSVRFGPVNHYRKNTSNSLNSFKFFQYNIQIQTILKSTHLPSMLSSKCNPSISFLRSLTFCHSLSLIHIRILIRLHLQE